MTYSPPCDGRQVDFNHSLAVEHGRRERDRERVNVHLLLFTNQLFLQRGDEDELDGWVSVLKMQTPDGGTQSQSPRLLTGIPIRNLHNH